MKLFKLKWTAIVLSSLIIIGCDGKQNQSSDATDENQNLTVTVINVDQATLVASVKKLGSTNAATESSPVTEVYDFPETSGQKGSYEMTIPAGDLPGFSTRRTIEEGAGAAVGYGDTIGIKYDMFSWATGELVETTSQQLNGNTQLELTENGAVPSFLKDSIVGRNVGDVVQVVFEKNLTDLPDYMNNNDAYILIVELVE